jgi:hypothetical protein
MSKIVVILCVVTLIAVACYTFSSRSYFSSNHPLILEIKENLAKLNPEYKKIPIIEGDSSYTENKSVISLCLKDPTTGAYYSMNVLMYVVLHELAHVLTKSHGHGAEFRKKFSELLREAANRKIYDPSQRIPDTYCGVKA